MVRPIIRRKSYVGRPGKSMKAVELAPSQKMVGEKSRLHSKPCSRPPYRSTAMATAFPPPRHGAANHFVDQGDQHTRPAGADGMAQSHCAPVHIHAVHIEAQLVADSERLHRKSFVQLVEIDIILLPARLRPDFLH